MVQVIDNKVVRTSLPLVGYLQSGESVSGYNLLPDETLRAEGWLPLEEDKAEYDPVTQELKFDSYEILEDKVIKHYVVIDKTLPADEF